MASHELLQDGTWRQRWGRDEIRDLATLLLVQITAKQEEIGSLKIALQTVQDQCPHDGGGVKKYRNHEVGQCLLCEKKFMARHAVDEIYST